MRKTLILLLLMATILPSELSAKKKAEPKPYDIKVMSYNIRMGVAKDGTNSWEYRYPATALMIIDQEPDVFGVQEAFDFQLYYLKENHRDYKYVGVGREDGRSKGEHMAIFWNKKTTRLHKWGTFWLSDTPDKPSMGWDAACYRTATWALMSDIKTGNKYYFINTHLDHVGKEAQKNGLKLIVSKIAEINKKGYPMVLVGDFNILPTNPALDELDTMMDSARKVADKTDNHRTFNGWGKEKTNKIIDYIYLSGFSKCPEYHTVIEKYADRTYVSDHFPITATIIF